MTVFDHSLPTASSPVHLTMYGMGLSLPIAIELIAISTYHNNYARMPFFKGTTDSLTSVLLIDTLCKEYLQRVSINNTDVRVSLSLPMSISSMEEDT